MELILKYIPPVLGCLTGLALCFKPKPFLKVIGTAYWNLAKFTAIGKTEESKKYFYTENTLFLKLLGVIMFFIGIAGILARTN